MREYFTPPNLITSGNLVAGFLALILSAQAEYGWAAGMVLVATGLDAADGAAARRGGDQASFGSQLDSLADLVSFGVAPALALYLGVLHSVPFAGIAACLAFVVAGAWRLARFPLVRRPGCFLGLPIPPAGAVAVLVAALTVPPSFALTITVGLALLMASTLPFPTVGTLCGLVRRRADVPAKESGVAGE